jgi:hypothetical protein
MIDSLVLTRVAKHSLVSVVRHINQTVYSGHDFEVISVNVLGLLLGNPKGDCTVKHLTQGTLLATVLVADTFHVELTREPAGIKFVDAVKLLEPICNWDPTVALTIETPARFQLRNKLGKLFLVKSLNLIFQELKTRLIVITVLLDVMHRSRHLS